MLKYIGKLFVLLQSFLIFSWFLGEKVLPFQPRFSGWDPKGVGVGSLFWSRANFDGVHYLGIARHGYGYLQEAFFPFYPQTIRLFQPIFKNYILSGLFVANLAFFLMLIVFWKLLEMEGIGKKTIKKVLFLLIAFPTSFYFLSVYTESLFLLLVLSSFYFSRRSDFLLAGLIAGLAAYTKLIGVFLFPALLVEYYQQESRRQMIQRATAIKEGLIHFRPDRLTYVFRSRLKHLRPLFFISLSSWGLLKYMYYLHKVHDSWLYFIKVQPAFGSQRSVHKLILIYRVFWRYLKMIVTVGPGHWLYFNVWLELLTVTLFLGFLAWGWYKREKYKIRDSWLVFATLAFFLPTLTGTFSSMPRYALVSFPAFIVLARLFTDLKEKGLGRVKMAYLIISLTLLFISSMFFFRGYWVA